MKKIALILGFLLALTASSFAATCAVSSVQVKGNDGTIVQMAVTDDGTGSGNCKAVVSDPAVLAAVQAAIPSGANLIGSVAQGTPAASTASWPTSGGQLADVTGTFTNATQTTSITTAALAGYGSVLATINGTYATATAVFEVSDDAGTTWYSIQGQRSDGAAADAGYTTLTNISRAWWFSIPAGDLLRVRSTAVATGTVNIRLSVSSVPNPGASPAVSGAIQAATITAAVPGSPNLVQVLSVQGETGMTPVQVTQSGYTYTHIATSTTTTIKSGAGVLHTICVNSLGTVASSITVDDAATATTPTIAVINSLALLGCQTYDVAFSVGLTLVTTGTVAPDVTVSWR